jgi:hypothetical protein
VAQHLEGHDRLAEGAALAHVGDGLCIRELGDGHAVAGEHQALDGEVHHDHHEAGVLGADAVATGTRQPSKVSSAVSEAHQPIFWSFLLTEKPGVPRSITSMEMPPWPGPPVRTAVVIEVGAGAAEVMKVLAPSTT